MLSYSFFDFIPVDLRNRRVARVDNSKYKTGARYAKVTV